MALGAGTASSSFVISGWLGVLLTLLGITGAAAFIVTYFRSSLNKTTIESYHQANDALEARIKSLEVDVAAAKEHEQRCEAQLEAQKQVNQILADRVEGVSAVKELRVVIEEKFDRMVDRLNDMVEGQDHMAEALGGLVNDIRRREGLDELDRRNRS